MPAEVALLGTTASGKSAVALSVARRLGECEIISIDSMAVYRGMDIATAKPTAAERLEIPHHMIDIVDPTDEYSVAEFQRDAIMARAEIKARGHSGILVGGTGLHFRAVLDELVFPGRYPDVVRRLTEEAEHSGGPSRLFGHLRELDPLGAARIEPANMRRIVRALEVSIGSGLPFSSFGPGLERYPAIDVPLVGIPFDADRVDAAVEDRVHSWLEAGLLDEVRQLVGRCSRTARQALGYRELLEVCESGLDRDPAAVDVALSLVIQRTRTFARRQAAWFRRDPRIHWISAGEDPVDVLCDFLTTSAR